MASTSDEPKPSEGGKTQIEQSNLAESAVTHDPPHSPPSDNDGGERPVRKQLRETTIESTPAKENGRKRSFEESRDDLNNYPDDGEGRRKRSRSSTPTNEQSSETAKAKEASSATTAPSEQNVSGNSDTPKDPISATKKDQVQDERTTEVSPLETEALEPKKSPKVDAAAPLAHSEPEDQREYRNDSVPKADDEHSVKRDPSAESSEVGTATDMAHPEHDPVSEDQRERCNDSVPEADDEHPEKRDLSCEIPDNDQEFDSPLPSPESSYSPDPNLFPNSPESRDSPNPDLPKSPASEPGFSAETQPSSSEAQMPESQHEVDVNDDPSSQETSNSGATDSSKGLTKKRSREQLDQESPKKSDAMKDSTQTTAQGENSTAQEERETKRPRDNSEEKDKENTNKVCISPFAILLNDLVVLTNHHLQLFSQSAFANASVDSPFAKLATAKPPAPTEAPAATDKPASSSAFAGSTLGSFAGSDKSPFGVLGASTSSVFKSASPFGSTGTAGTSALGGFGGIGGGFGSASTGLTSFASPNVSSTFGETKPKPLGAEDSENEEEEEDDDEENDTFEAAKTDERFYAQTIETGEEEESTIFACKAKLYGFSAGEWKERGIGTFKLNVRHVDGKRLGRMIMRADGALRVMLNSPVFQGMKYGDAKSQAPTSRLVYLASMEDGHTLPLLLRTPNEGYAQDLFEAIKGLLAGGDEE
ncbi:hypothetical protein N7532_000537 [Penicillium argentinense]|uniref:RanBD1 domain-containing protein n=1 Tax=Penicillium argentinense TaxID=1131581 RepID=A0A9W9G6W9_9EURO|nr:uncharacterized protein N7532_000537 [Penicillium argentinense]KAJ5112492.1 hypothetical protein N7532_000537 [Penicillium argentinense]